MNALVRRKIRARLCWGNLEERDCLEVRDILGRIILKWILKETRCHSTHWIHLVKDRDKWRNLVTRELTFRFRSNV